MENLIVTRENCNTFNFEYSDIDVDLTINIKEIPTVGVWDGNISTLPTYLTITIPHVISPAILPNVYNLTLPSDKIYAFEYLKYRFTTSTNNVWYLPSKEDLHLMYLNLWSGNDGINTYTPVTSFYSISYWSSSESSDIGAWVHSSSQLPLEAVQQKQNSHTSKIRPVGDFISSIDLPIRYNLGNGNYIFNKVDLLDGTFQYYYCSISDSPTTFSWSDITDVAIGTTSELVGFGQSNSDMMLLQSPTCPTILYCNNLIEEVTYPTEDILLREYSIYSIFCDLLECRLALLKRILGELDNCKERCDCIAVYDYIAFGTIYEAITSLYHDIFGDYNPNMNMDTLSAESLALLTTFEDLMIQYKKYCVECEKPCKNC